MSVNQYHSPRKLFLITDWARNLSWVVLSVYIAATLLIVNHRFPTWFSQGYAGNGPFGSPLIIEGALVATNLIAGIVFFVVLQAVAEFAYILMDVEENTHSQKD